MREFREYGSARGALSNERPYREPALAERYRIASRKDKGRILDEFTGLTGMHRKHAMRLLSGKPRTIKSDG